jgi:tryptophanyl-tRNA synthetase
MEEKKRLLTGLQPSGSLHIGNYFGALKPFADKYEHYESFLMVADYHALTSLKNPKELRQNILDIVKDYVAAGINPKQATIFQQSQVQAHTELAWIFETLVTIPFLMQAHAYKDKVAKGIEANAGLFNYPMLMATDILLYDANLVPVGKDQDQHLEYAREAATKFNNAFGDLFVSPKGLELDAVDTVPGIDGQKMSKSYKNTIPLFGTKDEIEKAVMSIVTDSKGDRPVNVYEIHKLFKVESELINLYSENGGNYKVLKEALVEDIESYVAPMREKRNSITDDDARNILNEGSDYSRKIADTKMEIVRKAIGVAL